MSDLDLAALRARAKAARADNVWTSHPPEFVLALLDRLEAAERERDEMSGTIDGLLVSNEACRTAIDAWRVERDQATSESVAWADHAKCGARTSAAVEAVRERCAAVADNEYAMANRGRHLGGAEACAIIAARIRALKVRP